jgi:hypothetical protein
MYIHVDRARKLLSGDIVDLKDYSMVSNIANYNSQFLDAEFQEHLKKLIAQGLSFHGYNYLCNTHTVDYNSLLIELEYEFTRWNHFPDCPSRFQSFLGWDDLGTAKAFAKRWKSPTGLSCDLYEFAPFEHFDQHRCDMNGLKIDGDAEKSAFRYWNGEPASHSKDYKPIWECLVNLPIRIILPIQL